VAQSAILGINCCAIRLGHRGTNTRDTDQDCA
jgi:hypothetical protein